MAEGHTRSVESSMLEMQVAITGVVEDALASTTTLQGVRNLEIPSKTDRPFQGRCR